jgi:hypothetical protein
MEKRETRTANFSNGQKQLQTSPENLSPPNQPPPQISAPAVEATAIYYPDSVSFPRGKLLRVPPSSLPCPAKLATQPLTRVLPRRSSAPANNVFHFAPRRADRLGRATTTPSVITCRGPDELVTPQATVPSVGEKTRRPRGHRHPRRCRQPRPAPGVQPRIIRLRRQRPAPRRRV